VLTDNDVCTIEKSIFTKPNWDVPMDKTFIMWEARIVSGGYQFVAKQMLRCTSTKSSSQVCNSCGVGSSL